MRVRRDRVGVRAYPFETSRVGIVQQHCTNGENNNYHGRNGDTGWSTILSCVNTNARARVCVSRTGRAGRARTWKKNVVDVPNSRSRRILRVLFAYYSTASSIVPARRPRVAVTGFRPRPGRPRRKLDDGKRRLSRFTAHFVSSMAVLSTLLPSLLNHTEPLDVYRL